MDAQPSLPPAGDLSPARRAALRVADGVDRIVTGLCRLVVLVTGIALTAILTANVIARYVFAAGGLDAAQELPERIFPWFIVAGVALAAQAGGHMSVEALPGMLRGAALRALLLFGNVVVIVCYAILFREALTLADIAAMERSPVLGLPGSHGYWAIAAGFALVALTTVCSSVRMVVLDPSRRFALTHREI